MDATLSSAFSSPQGKLMGIEVVGPGVQRGQMPAPGRRLLGREKGPALHNLADSCGMGLLRPGLVRVCWGGVSLQKQ